MTNARWQEIQSTFDALTALGDAERSNRLTALAISDPELHAAVAALLTADSRADNRLAPLEEMLLPLPRAVLASSRKTERHHGERSSSAAAQIAEQLNAALAERYHIEREIGSGGMAIVFQAHDLRHDRLIALKVLNPELGAILGAKRFLEEIKVTANLQHPNLLPLFDSGETNGLLYYVMPYIEGESLRSRLTRELQLPIDEAVHIAASVAGALDYAHAHGVIHRDLKPENILLQRGEPMVADFGIALAVKRAGGERMTESGISLGTPKYMSPEQATAERSIDGRSDIYSLGVVLYEMLTGETPHNGRSAQAIFAKVITEPVPPICVNRPNAPEHVEHAVASALEKIPADRWQTAGAFADALTGGKRVAASQVPRLLSSSRRAVRRQAAIIAVVGFVAGLSLAWLSGWLRSSPPSRLTWHTLVLPESLMPATPGGLDRDLALSQDGTLLAYVGGRMGEIIVRRLDELTPRVLPGTQGAECPAFSPDGRWLFYSANGRILKAALSGGSPIMLVDSASACSVWTDRDEVVFRSREGLSGVPAAGGPVTILSRLDTSRVDAYMRPTQALPGGRDILIDLSKTRSGTDFQLGLVSLPDGKITSLTHTETDGEARFNATYSRGRLVFQHGKSIVSAPFSLSSRNITGPEVTILRDTIYNFVTSPNGHAAYRSTIDPVFSLVGVGLDGSVRLLTERTVEVSRNGRSLIDVAHYAWPRLSPDGRRVALEMETGTHSWDVFIYDIRTGSLSRLSTNFSGIRPLGWSVDGEELFYFRLDTPSITAPRHLVRQSWDASSPARELFKIPANTHDVSLGPPHGYAVIAPTGTARERLHEPLTLLPLDSPAAAQPLLPAQPREWGPRVSPNGKFLAYVGDETGHWEVYLRPLPNGKRVQVSADGGTEPAWSPDGKWLFYRGPEYMMRAGVGNTPPAVLHRDTLFKDIYLTRDIANYDVFPSGKELLMIRSSAVRNQIGVIENWPELLRQRAIIH